MNYITYRYKLYELNFKRNFLKKSLLKNIVEARENGNGETLEKLYSLLNANNINYEKSKCKLLTKYFLLKC